MAEELGIPLKQEEWTTEDNQTFSEYERQHNIYLRGWSEFHWKYEAKRREISQELGIPLQQADWTTDDWQRYSEHSEWTYE